MAGPFTDVTDATFQAEVLESEKPVLVDFWAAWCGPCRVMDPILDQIQSERDDLKIVSVDVDTQQELASQWGVMGMPTFMLFNHGAPVQTLVGSRPRKRLELELQQALVEQPAGRGGPRRGGGGRRQRVAGGIGEAPRADDRTRPLEPARRHERDPQAGPHEEAHRQRV